jgi:hypothetical protein
MLGRESSGSMRIAIHKNVHDNHKVRLNRENFLAAERVVRDDFDTTRA